MNVMNAPSPVIDQTESLIADFKRWRPQIERALQYAYGSHTFDDLFSMVIRGQLMFFPFDDCFLFMEVTTYPRYKVLHGFLSGGDLKAILGKEQQMLDLAKALGCRYLSAAGRMGWKKAFEELGWDFSCVTMHKEVDYGER